MDDNIGLLIGLITLAITLLGIAWKFGSYLVSIAKRLESFFEDWEGEKARPGVPGRLGVMERLQRNEDAIEQLAVIVGNPKK